MRRIAVTAALMISLLALSACSERSNEEKFEDLRSEALRATSVTAEVLVRQDLGNTVADYRLDFLYEGTESTITVTEPLELAGVKVSISEDLAEINYEGIMLGTGEFENETPTPVTAMSIITHCILEGHIESVWAEGEYYAIVLIPNDDIKIELRINNESGMPETAYIIEREDGTPLLRCDINDFSMR